VAGTGATINFRCVTHLCVHIAIQLFLLLIPIAYCLSFEAFPYQWLLRMIGCLSWAHWKTAPCHLFWKNSKKI